MLDRSSDFLSEVLHDLRPSGVSYGHCRLTAPWGVELPPEPTARLHLVVAGSAWLREPSGRWLPLGVGDVAFLPRGLGHALADASGRPTRPLAELPAETVGELVYRMEAGGGGAPTLMACCSVGFREPALHPLLELMPPLLLLRGATTADAALPTLLEAMAVEVTVPRIGAATILARLADVVIVRLIRAWAEAHRDDARGWLAAVRDPRLGRALAALHRRPGERWSIEALAAVAGMSRSVFCERFTAVVGASPARYLARWRMHLASAWLREGGTTVAEAAVRLGYESEASFGRAFRRQLGVPPGAWRRGAA